MQSIIQVLKLNDPKTGMSAKTGKAYDMQDAECLLLTEDGQIDQVGVLQVPKNLRDKIAVGTYRGTFAMQANFASRRIEAVLTDLTPFPGSKASGAAAPAAAPAAPKA